jgi:hypothetical protein
MNTEYIASIAEADYKMDVSLIEFAAYCKRLKKPNFSLGTLDQYAREKGQAQAPAASQLEAI